MATIDELKSRIDLHDLANRLGLERPDEKGNYRSPKHKDKNPSLSIYNDGKSWKDWSTEQGGDCIDLVMYIEGCDTAGALKRLHDLYNLPRTPQQKKDARDKTLAEHIADKCFDAEGLRRAADYLTQERGITPEVVQAAIERRAVGYNDYTSPKVDPGHHGHGGPAVAFIVKTLNPGHVAAVDMRYLDPALNGGTKTQCQGEKYGYVWTSDLRRLQRARDVYLVESPINALSVESAVHANAAAVATRGTGNISNVDWHFLQGKRVIVAMDNDEPNEQTGYCPGEKAAWGLLEQMTSLNIAAHLVDQTEWEHNDLNDILRDAGREELAVALKRLNPYIIPGVHGNRDHQKGRTRVYLPSHDYAQYWRYRAKEDFVTYVEKWDRDEESGDQKESFKDVCGFRIAAIQRVSIASATSTLTGEADAQPRVLFACSVQVPRHGNKLIRKVFDDDRLHNVDQWRKFGPVYSQTVFLRMVNILERSADLGARDAVNFVGLAWRDGKLIVNEGADCYFTEPLKQCTYHNLVFPSGPVGNARRVIEAYQQTFGNNAAALPLVWGLGGHLKALLGFWPHMMVQSEKGAGKTTLLKRMEGTIGYTLFSNESLKTAFRILTTVSYTSHPVGWEELSASGQKVIDEAVSMLQQAYQYTPTKRGSDMTDFLISAPVLLAGEDVPVRSLTGKIIRTDLATKGPMLPWDLPKFPVRQWLQFLTKQSREEVMQRHQRAVAYCWEHSRTRNRDSGASRMVENYAAMLAAWGLLCEFAGIDKHQGGFINDLVAEMNRHIADSCGDREPWVWILETIMHEIAAGHYRMPYTWTTVRHEDGTEEDCLALRTGQVMHHIKTENRLRATWDSLPVKTDRVFKQQLIKAGVLADQDLERRISGKRVAHMVAISLARAEEYGLQATPPEVFDNDPQPTI